MATSSVSTCFAADARGSVGLRKKAKRSETGDARTTLVRNDGQTQMGNLGEVDPQVLVGCLRGNEIIFRLLRPTLHRSNRDWSFWHHALPFHPGPRFALPRRMRYETSRSTPLDAKGDESLSVGEYVRPRRNDEQSRAQRLQSTCIARREPRFQSPFSVNANRHQDCIARRPQKGHTAHSYRATK
jgi:hypothetical protein